MRRVNIAANARRRRAPAAGPLNNDMAAPADMRAAKGTSSTDYLWRGPAPGWAGYGFTLSLASCADWATTAVQPRKMQCSR